MVPPEVALSLFAQATLYSKPIDVFNYGNMQRGFFYVDDIIEGVLRVLGNAPQPGPELLGRDLKTLDGSVPYRVYNIGNQSPVEPLYFIAAIGKCLGMEARKNLLLIQPGDVPATFADVDALMRDVGFKPDTPIEVGVRRFVEWYREYYRA